MPSRIYHTFSYLRHSEVARGLMFGVTFWTGVGLLTWLIVAWVRG